MAYKRRRTQRESELAQYEEGSSSAGSWQNTVESMRKLDLWKLRDEEKQCALAKFRELLKIPEQKTVEQSTYPPPLPTISSSALYEQAFSHRSVESSVRGTTQSIKHNERLEFLGDSCLGFVITKAVYERFPMLREGDMTEIRSSLVNNTSLSELAKYYKIREKILLGQDAEADNVRNLPKVTADCFEAYLGAVCIDSPNGFEVVERFLRRLVEPRMTEFDAKFANFLPVDKFAKQTLYHMVGGGNLTIDYKWVGGGGGNHGGFEVGLIIEDKEVTRGVAANRKDAGLRAAMAAIAQPSLVEEFIVISKDRSEHAQQAVQGLKN